MNSVAGPSSQFVRSGTCNFAKVREVKRTRLVNLTVPTPSLVEGKVELTLQGPSPHQIGSRLRNDRTHPCFGRVRLAGPVQRTPTGIRTDVDTVVGTQKQLRRKFNGRKTVVFKKRAASRSAVRSPASGPADASPRPPS